MNSRYYILFLIFVLFLAQNVMNFFGISNKIYALYVGIAIVFMIFNKQCLARSNKNIMIFIVLSVLVAFLKMKMTPGEGAKVRALNLISMPIIFGCFPTIASSPHFWKKATKVILFFYVVECGLAIFERITLTNIFPWNINTDSITMMMDTGDDAGEFRSFALLGHPLQNALPVCTMMAFILCSTTMKTYRKILLWLLGYVAIFCFNTRSSMVGAAFILGLYLLKEYMTNRKISFAKKNIMLFGAMVGAIGFVYVAVSLNLGGRLFEMGLFDENSAQVRVDTWSIFDYFKLSDFMFGVGDNAREKILFRAGLYTTENFWIDYLISLGVIGFGILIYAYILAIRSIYHNFKFWDIIITLASFILIASTNNSLSASWMPLFIYMISICIFSYNEMLPEKRVKK